MVAEKFITRRSIPCFDDSRDSSILQNAAASLKHDRMVIDNENTGHVVSPPLHYNRLGPLLSLRMNSGSPRWDISDVLSPRRARARCARFRTSCCSAANRRFGPLADTTSVIVSSARPRTLGGLPVHICKFRIPFSILGVISRSEEAGGNPVRSRHCIRPV